MEWIIQAYPTKETIYFVDQMIEKYTQIYNLRDMREIGFVAHELVVNAVEAMNKAKKSEREKIQIHFLHENGEIKITVIDAAGGIPSEYWEDIIYLEMNEMTYSERGRGLFFVKHFVDKIWFEKLSGNRFLVGVSKKLNG